MKFATCALVLVSVLTVVSSSAAKPPSFALMIVAYDNHVDAIENPLAATCQKLYSGSDAKWGACEAKGLHATFAKLEPDWERRVQRVAIGQPAPCKTAIHRYYLAAKKNFDALQLYLAGHASATNSDLKIDLAGEPYTTLGQLKDAAKSRAIRACG